MKKPKFKLSPAAIRDFFVAHGEKVACAAVGAFALLLAWWGIDAIRTQAVKLDRKPDAVTSLAARASENIDNNRKVPAERLPSRAALPPAIDPWRPQQVKIAPAPSAGLLLDRPLFAELSRRSKPDVFPIDSLRAVAGVAVLPDPAAPAGGPESAPRQPDLAPPLAEDPRRWPPRGRPPRGREMAGEGSPFGLEGGLTPELAPAAAVQAGKITPYVVVTGLIPTLKQQQEFERRFVRRASVIRGVTSRNGPSISSSGPKWYRAERPAGSGSRCRMPPAPMPAAKAGPARCRSVREPPASSR